MASLWLRITEKRDNPPVVRRLDLASLPVEGRLPVLIVLERLDDFVVRKTAKEKTIALSDFTIYYRFGIHRRGGIALLFRDEEGGRTRNGLHWFFLQRFCLFISQSRTVIRSVLPNWGNKGTRRIAER